MTNSLEKFLSGSALVQSDMNDLKLRIFESDNIYVMSDAIYAYSYSFGVDQEICRFCIKIVCEIRTPFLASTCYKALIRHWGILSESVSDSFDYYLNCENFELYFDELMIISHFLLSEEGKPFRKSRMSLVSKFISWARLEGIYENDEL